MSLNLMYITNDPDIALIAEKNGIDRIFVDLEYIGKSDRQGGMDTVQSRHTIEDVKKVSDGLSSSKLLVRVNPIHDASPYYPSSKDEIDAVIKNGADILMLPYFKTVKEVSDFIKFADKRAKTMLLVETPEAVECLDEILELDGIDEIHIGLNDLSLALGMKFMFELLADGTVDNIISKIKKKGIPYGFGGIASLGNGLLPSEHVIAEHYRLGSSFAILSRSFCNSSIITDKKEIEKVFSCGMKDIRNFEKDCQNGKVDFISNRKQVLEKVKLIIGE